MPFFLPGRLVSLEYLAGEPDPEYEAIAESYLDDIDFAFFAVELGYTRSDYEQLTRRQIAFIRKAWEDKEVRQTNLMNAAINNALANLHRKKGKAPIPLWHKVETVDKEKIENSIKVVEEMEERDGKGWIRKIWAAHKRGRL